MASKLAEKAPGWFTRLLLPELGEIKGELKALRAETQSEFKMVNGRIVSLENKMDGKIDSLETKVNGRIDSLENKMDGRINSLETKMDAEFRIVHTEIKSVNEKVEGLDKRLDVVQRLAVLEAKLKEYEAKARP